MSFDESEYDLESQAAEALTSLASEEAETLAAEQQSEQILHQAVQRIEEANLFKLLITQQVFAPGSANPQILASVNNKIKQFAIRELELLLGIDSGQRVEQVKSPFDEDETQALKILASKVLKRDVKPATVLDKKAELQPITAMAAPKQVSPSIAMAQPSLARSMANRPTSTQSIPKKVPPKKSRPSKKNEFAKPMGAIPMAMPTADEYMMKTGMVTPKPNYTAESVIPQGGSTLASVINQLTGGNLVHDAGSPSESEGSIDDRF